MAKTRLLWFLFLLSVPVLGCQSPDTGVMLGESEPTQTQLPQIKVNLPPAPSFQKEHAPEKYADGALSVYGLRKDMAKNIGQQVRVKAFIIEVYECPPCAKKKKSECPNCIKPHFWLSDRAGGTKDSGLMVTDYPKQDPETRKKVEYFTGRQYHVTGVFSRSSGTGFSAADGLLAFQSAQLVETE